MATSSAVPAMGDIVFPAADWAALVATLRSLASTEEKVDYLAETYPGIASVVLMAGFTGAPEMLANIQKLNGAIAYHKTCPSVPGANHRLAYQIQPATPSILEALLLSSTRLRARDITAIREATTTHAGGDCYVFIQPSYTSGGDCRGVHAEAVYLPKDPRDGKPWFTTTLIDPKARGKNGEAVARLYEDLMLDQVSPRAPGSAFEIMQSANPPDPQLGQYNVAFADWLENDKRMFEYVMSVVSGDPSKVVYHSQGVIKIACSREQLRQAAISREVILKCHELGTIATLGAHCGMNSCAHCVMANFTLGSLLPGPGDRILPLDRILYSLIDRAETVYWTEQKGLRVRQFMSEGEGLIPALPREDMKDTLKAIFAKPTIMQSHDPARPSYGAQYLFCDRLSVKPNADEAYQAVAAVHRDYLAERLAEMEDR